MDASTLKELTAICGIDCFNCEFFHTNIDAFFATMPAERKRGFEARGMTIEKVRCNGCRQGGCTTIEEWDSTNALHGSHNCNDDSELQVKAIHADSAQCRDCGSCHSFGLHNFAPDCR